MVKVVGVGSYKPAVEKLLQNSYSDVLSCNEILEIVDINLIHAL